MNDDMVCTCPYCQKKFRIREGGSQEPDNECECLHCGFVWHSRKANPVKCPRCGSYAWDRPPDIYRCKSCGHEWISRSGEPPKRCPRCNNPDYDADPGHVPEGPRTLDSREVCLVYDRG